MEHYQHDTEGPCKHTCCHPLQFVTCQFMVLTWKSHTRKFTMKMFCNFGHTALQWRKLGWLGRLGSRIWYFSQLIQLCLVLERLFKFHIVRKSKTHSFKKVFCRKGLKLSSLVIHWLLNLTWPNRWKITRDWRWETLFWGIWHVFWIMWNSGECVT